ncbi:helix-turn-helix domain-containing protein [Flavobacterium rhamnosiphilum]|uniref:Helix-turn-helix domain-containing protein n=1 Tax=Flavobacterium rhamnosiphilum TaxID=2541724 RepID=A0A4R5F2L0_9FLAO|nr:helix-turn-helix domain-containing protein [Flavobacterium rhamnosiphilum]TDE41684.1 helix-turn-helix domain-containing protein [Flavobacterium rhamnosiphilum]
MNFTKELLFFFSALGAFNGLVLSCYFFFFTKKKHLSNYFLGILLLALSIRIGKSVFIFFKPDLPRIYLQIGLSACFLIGPALFYFVKSSIEQTIVIPNKWKWHFAVLIAIILLVGTAFPYATYPKYWNLYFIKIIYLQWFVSILATGFLLRTILFKLFSKSKTTTENTTNVFEKWLLSIYGGNIIIFTSYVLSLMPINYPIYISGSIAYTFILYIFILKLLYRKKTDDLFSPSPNKYGNKKVDHESAALLIEKLHQLMAEKKIYQNANLTLSELSKEINISVHQLSQLLNDNMGKNFTAFINEYRINEACTIMLSENKLTLEGIGYEVGFNSKSTFFATFKKLKGTTPAIFLQNATK